MPQPPCPCHHLQGIFNWSDLVATSLLILVLSVVSLLAFFLGLPFLIAAVSMFILRPPKYRSVVTIIAMITNRDLGSSNMLAYACQA